MTWTLNKVFLIGNLTRDPEYKRLESGSCVTKFGLAINERYRSGETWKEKVCFVEVSVWARGAEIAREYLTKGQTVFIEGRLVYENWEDRAGQRHSQVRVEAIRMQMMDRKPAQPRGKPTDSPDYGAPDTADAGPDDVPF